MPVEVCDPSRPRSAESLGTASSHFTCASKHSEAVLKSSICDKGHGVFMCQGFLCSASAFLPSLHCATAAVRHQCANGFPTSRTDAAHLEWLSTERGVLHLNTEASHGHTLGIGRPSTTASKALAVGTDLNRSKRNNRASLCHTSASKHSSNSALLDRKLSLKWPFAWVCGC